jgi:CHAD domain-containing protein
MKQSDVNIPEIERTAVGKARFRVMEGEPLAAAMKRILIGEILEAHRVLEDRTVGRDEAVHGARRHMKWMRSIWYVLDTVPGANRDARRAQIRDTARLLAGARDADVMAAEARRLLARADGRAHTASLRLVERLEAEARAAHAEAPPIATVLSRLRAAEADARSLPTRFEAGRLLADGLVASYRRGRRDWRAIDDGASTEALHDWRKRVKRRRHLSALVPVANPATTRAIQADLDDLGEILGEEHDLALLRDLVERTPTLIAPSEGRDDVLDLIADRRRKLKKVAIGLGEELYGAKTRSFAEELVALRDL